MDSADQRPHRRGTSTSELFICFTSRLSSIKIPHKSILSPGRSRDAPVSLSTSLSRRLRTNGSLKGGQSPMFPTGGKKRGTGFENPEPSSPKVTCIGQVRVKTKKQGKRIRTLSKRRGGGGEVSFRRVDPNRNQRWVHLQLTICEAVRAFGAEFSCLFPCFSTGGREKEERGTESSERSGRSSCGAVFARWFVALQDGEGGKGREVELVVGEDGERKRTETRARKLERHLGEEIGVGDEVYEVNEREAEEEEEEGRVSICIPPKNALLLMRCRSDPIRVSALTNRFWESPPKCEDEDEENEDEDDHSQVLHGDSQKMEDTEELVSEAYVKQKNPESEANVVMEVEGDEGEVKPEVEKLEIQAGENLEPELEEGTQKMAEGEIESDSFACEAVVDREKLENEDSLLILEREEVDERRASHHSSSSLVSSDSADEEEKLDVEKLVEESTLEEEEDKSTDEEETLKEEEKEEIVTQVRSESEQTQIKGGGSGGLESEERQWEIHANVERETKPVLPDCLLLMRCEPKLSMEVSKETWVCSTDFIRWLPERPAKARDGGDVRKKKRNSTDSNPAHHQPQRSSCSLPAAVPMAAMIEQRLVNAAAYEPLVLTRCKSEPMKTAAAKLVPETCFWKNRKLEPHRRARVGVGAAGVGF